MDNNIIKMPAHTDTHRKYNFFKPFVNKEGKRDVKYIGGYGYANGINFNQGSSAHFKFMQDEDYDPRMCMIHGGIHHTTVNGVCMTCQSKKGKFLPSK